MIIYYVVIDIIFFKNDIIFLIMGRLGPTQFSCELHGLGPKRRDCIWIRLLEAQYVQVRGHWAGPLA
jgi:hypothetical protein